MVCFMYGTAAKVGKAQKEFKNSYPYLIPRPIANFTHEHPVDMPSKVIKQPDMKKAAKAGGDRIMVS